MPFLTILNHPMVVELHIGADKYKYLLTLYKDNTKLLEKAFGAPLGTLDNARSVHGPRPSYWEEEYAGRLFRIVSGPRGTKYRVEYLRDSSAFRADPIVGGACCDFLEHVYQTLYGDT